MLAMHNQLSENRAATKQWWPTVGRVLQCREPALLLHQSGGGSPAVVFLPGAGAFGLDYLNV